MRIIIILIFILVYSFYSWVVNHSTEPYWQPYDVGWYNILTDSLLQGKLHLLIEPRPELLTLIDPYDPIANGPYRLHDISFYKGKYYLYFGVTPALCLYLPYRLIFGIPISEKLSILIFSYGAFIWTALILMLIRKKYFPNSQTWIFIFSLLVLGFSNLVPAYLRRPMMYEVAISSGFFFLSGAMFWFCKAFKKKTLTFNDLFLGSLFLGLSIGCRQQFALSIILPVFLAIYILKNSLIKKEQINKLFFNLFFPIAICLLFLGAYNYLRFENPFHGGHQWQLTGFHPKKTIFFSREFLIPGIYLNLFQPPTFDLTIPYIHMRANLPPSLTPAKLYVVEIVSGLFPTVPITLLILISPLLVLLFLRNKSNFNVRFPVVESFIILIPALLNLSVLTVHIMVTLRYTVDFAPYLILFSCILWFYLDSFFVNNLKLRKVVNILSLVLAIYSIVFGLAFGTEQFFEKMKTQDPIEYSKIDSYIKPIAKVLFRLKS